MHPSGVGKGVLDLPLRESRTGVVAITGGFPQHSWHLCTCSCACVCVCGHVLACVSHSLRYITSLQPCSPCVCACVFVCLHEEHHIIEECLHGSPCMFARSVPCTLPHCNGHWALSILQYTAALQQWDSCNTLPHCCVPVCVCVFVCQPKQ